MAKNVMLKQVMLERPSGSGRLQDVFWIERSLAVKGERVKDDEGHIWTVIETYGTQSVEDLQRAIDSWREFAEVLDR